MTSDALADRDGINPDRDEDKENSPPEQIRASTPTQDERSSSQGSLPCSVCGQALIT